ncbi:UNVERIFIED_CONTAM: hypothetical protein K2H54_004653 [Gekko kuhli]
MEGKLASHAISLDGAWVLQTDKDNMSKEQNISGSGGLDPSQPEIPSPPSGSQSVDPGLSASRLTIENVKKLEGDYSVARSSLARQSVEAYLQQSSLLGSESEASREGRREPDVPSESESEAGSAPPLGEGTAEKDTEPSEKISDPGIGYRLFYEVFPED